MAESRPIDTDEISERYRNLSLDTEGRRLLISRISGSQQEADLTEPPNCEGFGRIRHFRRNTSSGWPSNPLPIDPACQALDLPPTDVLRAEAFQTATCNWRCWYCFVPFDLLAASPKRSAWLTPGQLVDLYLDQPAPPPLIDLTGGQPDLVPEWVPWMMAELRSRGLEDQVYLWSDDNLSTDYLWRYLSDADLALMSSYRCYGKVGCFKGFDAESFSFNTRAGHAMFDRQFELMHRLLDLGVDVYAYATFTTPPRPESEIRDLMARFVDRLQALDENLPLRTVPLEIRVFTPVGPRMHTAEHAAIGAQLTAVAAWQDELIRRYDDGQRRMNVANVPLRSRR